MVTIQTMLNQLTGDAITEALLEKMTELFPELPGIRARYDEAMELLQAELAADMTPSVQEVQAAIRRQLSSTLLFSAILGINANRKHFTDPASGDFLDTEPEHYLRENTARHLPGYEQAQQLRDRFSAQLTPAQKELYDDVITYTTYLETAGPKLAHYYGYLLGNTLLYHLEPGYQPDKTQTLHYHAILNQYFGITLDTSVPLTASLSDEH